MPALDDMSTGSEIRAAIDDLVLEWPDVSPGNLFGSRAYRADGVLFAMIGGKGLILTKLDPEQRERAAGAHGAHPFVGHGREVPAWIEFRLTGAEGVSVVGEMVSDSYANALAEAGRKQIGRRDEVS